MRKLYLVARYEFTTAIRRPSFWLATLFFPLLVIALSLGPQLLGQKAMEERSVHNILDTTSTPITNLFTLPSGYVDHAELIHNLPPSLPPGWFIRYTTESEAQSALIAGTIGRYYIISPDYLEEGEITMVTPSSDPMVLSNARTIFTFVINYNLLHDEARVARLFHPLAQVKIESLSARKIVDESNPQSYALPMGVMILLLMLISMSSGFVLNSVVKEKEDRTAELMLLRLSPRSLIMGKIIGLGGVASLQMFIWLGGMTIAGRNAALWERLHHLRSDPTLLKWTALYFILGYILYAAEMAVIGTLAPSRRESGSVTFFVLLPVIAPAWFSTPILERPDGVIALLFSLFPPSVPVVMPMRMTLTTVPMWQRLVAAAGLTLTAWLLVTLSGRFFRADTLLSRQSFNWRRLMLAWKREQ